MLKTLKYGWVVFKYSWEANGVWAFVSVLSNIYKNTLYPLIQILLLSRVLDIFSKHNVLSINDFSWIIAVYIVASLINIIFSRFTDSKEEFFLEKLMALLDHKIIKKLIELDPATFEKPSFQSLLAQIDGVKGTMQAHLVKFTNLINFVVKFITAALVVSTIFPLFIPLFIIAAIPIYIAWDRARKRSWPYYVEKRSGVLRITQYIKTLLSSDSTSKEAVIFKTGPVLLSKVDTQRSIYFRNMDKAVSPGMYEITLASIFQFLIFLYTQYLTLSAVLKNTLSIGQFALVFQQSLNLALGAEEILNQYSSIDARTKYLDKFFDFLNTEKVIKSPLKPISLPDSPSPSVIEFKDVSFKYPKTDRLILKNFNMKIDSSEKIALVGENGAGKTTIIKLILRFYDVTEGEILINGVNIKELDLDKWHQQVGALFQDFIKYQFTFKENVYFGNLDKKDNIELLKEAIKQSGADKYLDNLPKSLDQVVGKMFDEGIDLSGGQWQKLALARAFFRNAPLLILDEPTSSIDAKAEYEIFENVQKLQKDKTVIIISHRFSTVRNADRILVLDEGKIVEEGNHEKLMKKRGLYAELFNLQAEGYK